MSIRTIQKKYCSRALMVSILLGTVFLVMDDKAVCKGLILGTLFSILNFILIGETLPARIQQKWAKRVLLSPGSISFRYLLLSVPVVLAIKSDSFNLISTVGGIMSVQLMILTDHLVSYFGMRKTTGIG